MNLLQNCLLKQLSPGTGETSLVAWEVKCSPGRIGLSVSAEEWKSCSGRHKMSLGRLSPGVLQRGVLH